MRFQSIAVAGLLISCSCGTNSPDSGMDLDGGTDVEIGDSPLAEADAPRLDAGPVVPPPPPTWMPPFDLSPAVGWRDSRDPVCSPFAGRSNGGRVWADDRGVFGLIGTLNNELAFDPPYPNGVSLHFNDGSGWELWHEVPYEPGSGGANRFIGAFGGPLYLWNGGCPLQRVDGPDTVVCAFDASEVSDAFFVAADQGLLVAGGPPSVLAFDGTTTTPVAALRPSEREVSLWSDGISVVVVTDERILTGPMHGPLGEVAGVRPRERVTAAFVGGADDIWIATEAPAAARHFDGSAWTDVSLDAVGEVVTGLWSDGSSLFLISQHGLRELVGETLSVVFTLPVAYPAYVESISGSAARGEVYLAIGDDGFIQFACGPTFFVVYDGATLRRF